jgi:hypothetical protein
VNVPDQNLISKPSDHRTAKNTASIGQRFNQKVRSSGTPNSNVHASRDFICFRCLSPGHLARACKSYFHYKSCHKFGHKLRTCLSRKPAPFVFWLKNLGPRNLASKASEVPDLNTPPPTSGCPCRFIFPQSTGKNSSFRFHLASVALASAPHWPCSNGELRHWSSLACS